MIQRSPKIVTFAIDFHEHLVEVLAPLPEALHPAYSLTPIVSREQRTEAVPPQPYRFMADVDAAFEQQIFNVPQA